MMHGWVVNTLAGVLPPAALAGGGLGNGLVAGLDWGNIGAAVVALSETTRASDLGTKLPVYRRIPSVRHILLVETREIRVEHWRREPDGWKVRDLGPGDVLLCDDLGIRISVDTLYEGLPIPPEPTAG